MGDAAQIQLDRIPSFLGLPVGDLEDLVPDQVAIAGYFCDNLDRPTEKVSCRMKNILALKHMECHPVTRNRYYRQSHFYI